MEELALKVEHVSKEYRLGTIGGGTLKAEIQSKIAKWRHKEDPNLKIGETAHEKNERFLALDDVSFEIKKGEKIGIIGHNGAGKSTILKLICRVTAPTKGNIYLNGRITSMLEVGTGFHGELTGRENIYLNGSILGMSKAEIDEKIDEIIEFSEVKQFIDTPVKRYSSGMHVKLGFAVASHLNSEIMIMDEVLAVGDMAFQKKCIDRMRKVADEEGRTILYVSHNMNTIRQLCDRVIVLNHGKKIFDGDVEKGIEMYSGKSEHSDQIVDLSVLERRQHCIDGIKLQKIEITSEKSWSIKVGSKIQFKIYAHATKDLKDVGYRSRITLGDETSISVLVAKGLINCKAGEDVVVPLEADLSVLVPGRYYLTPTLYTTDELGMYSFYDHIHQGVALDVETVLGFNDNTPWEGPWGNVKLPDLIDLR